VDGKPTLFFIIIKAHIAFWGSFGSILEKRRAIKKLGDTPVSLYPNSIVWQYFAKEKKKFSDL
jgi:hypothetical protein